MKVKIFNIASGDYSEKTGEMQINQWLKENPNLTLVNMLFKANSSRFILIVFYTENTL